MKFGSDSDEPGIWNHVQYPKRPSRKPNRASAVRKKAHDFAAAINKAFKDQGLGRTFRLDSFQFNQLSDEVLESLKYPPPSKIVMTEQMAKTAVRLMNITRTEIIGKPLTVMNIQKDTQGGKTADTQNMAILTAACLKAEKNIYVSPLFIIPNDVALQKQMEREWPEQMILWHGMILRHITPNGTGVETDIGGILDKWEEPEDDDGKPELRHRNLTTQKGMWAIRRSNACEINADWLRKIEHAKTVKNEHMLLFMDEADVGPAEGGVTDEMFGDAGLYDYLNGTKKDRRKSKLTLVNVSATLDTIYRRTADFAIFVDVEPDEGYRSQLDALTLLPDLAKHWDIPELLQLGQTAHASSNPYCNIKSFIKMWPEYEGLDKKGREKAECDPAVKAKWLWFKDTFVPETLAKTFTKCMELGYPNEDGKKMKFNGMTLRYVVQNKSAARLIDKVASLLGQEDVIYIPFHGKVSERDFPSEERENPELFFVNYKQGSDLQIAISKIKADELDADKPMFIMWTASGRRGLQVPDEIASIDFTSDPTTRASGKQNSGRPAGYKVNSLFGCTAKMHKSMLAIHDGKSSKKPNIHSTNMFGGRDQMVLHLEASKGVRDFPIIDKIFKTVEDLILRTNRNYEAANVALQYTRKDNGSLHFTIMAKGKFWDKLPEDHHVPNLIGSKDSIISEKTMTWIEKNEQKIFCSHDVPIYGKGSIKLLRRCMNGKEDLPRTWDQIGKGEEYYLLADHGGIERMHFSLRQGERQNTNLVWVQSEGGKRRYKGFPNAASPQIHYEVTDDGEINCVKIALRLTEPPRITNLIVPNKDTVMWKLSSDEEKAKINKYWESRNA